MLAGTVRRRSIALPDKYPGRREWFDVDIGVRGEDVTVIRLRGVKGDGGCPTLGVRGWVLGLLDASWIEALLRPRGSALCDVQLLPPTAFVGGAASAECICEGTRESAREVWVPVDGIRGDA